MNQNQSGLLSRLKRYLSHMNRIFCCKLDLSLLKNNIYVYKPSVTCISPSAKITVNDHFSFNKQWDIDGMKHNVIPGSLYVGDNAQLEVGSFVCHSGCRVTVNRNAKLTMRSGYLNYESVIDCSNSIEIGEDCAISERVIIRDSNNHTIVRDGYQETRPIRIGNHVWIGMGAMVLSGVTIGDGAIIAAGTIVNRDIPPKAMAAGVPARIVRTDVEWK